MKLARTIGIAMILSGLVFPASGQILHRKPKKAAPSADSDVAPDKVLYEKATDEIKHGKYEVARLQLEALLNTYPDSAYLANAKLAIADSYFKEGGNGNLNMAIDEYKSFITFFPNLDEAAYAQMQVAMTHYRRMDKADRDRTESQLAEQEFQTFLLKYPDSPLAAQSAQRLRDVQETLAEGDFKVASFYAGRKSSRAAAGRLTDIANRYPLYSKADQVLWMLANIWETAPNTTQAQEQLAAARRELAGTLFARIVRDYPLSKYVPGAKAKLTELGMPIPQPDPTALARMQQEQNTPRNRPSPFTHVTGIIHSGPDVSMAARIGTPTMTPPDETGDQTLAGASTNLSVGTTTQGGSGNSTTVQVVAPDGSGSTTPATGGTADSPTTGSSQPAGTSSNPPAPPAGTSSSSSSTPAQPGTTTDSQGKPQTPAAKPCPPDPKKGSSSDGKQAGCKADSTKESSSKKKGIKKIIPW